MPYWKIILPVGEERENVPPTYLSLLLDKKCVTSTHTYDVSNTTRYFFPISACAFCVLVLFTTYYVGKASERNLIAKRKACERKRLAWVWGRKEERKNGGVQRELFHPLHCQGIERGERRETRGINQAEKKNWNSPPTRCLFLFLFLCPSPQIHCRCKYSVLRKKYNALLSNIALKMKPSISEKSVECPKKSWACSIASACCVLLFFPSPISLLSFPASPKTSLSPPPFPIAYQPPSISLHLSLSRRRREGETKKRTI